MLVISENVLEKRAWNTRAAGYYSQSCICDYLASTHGYLSASAFLTTYSLDTESQILNVDTSRDDIVIGSGDEKLFLLSSSEVGTYFGTNSKTASSDGEAASWGLRTFDTSDVKAGNVNASGDVSCDDPSTSLGFVQHVVSLN